MASRRRNLGQPDEKVWPADRKVESEIVGRIVADYRSTILSPSGQIALVEDVTSEGILSAVRIENFMDQVSKSDQCAVEFDKNLTNISCLKITPLGKELYRLLAPPRFAPPQMQPGEGFKLFDEVMQELNVSQALFTSNPMHLTSPSGLLEGDFLNVILTRLREGTRCKSYKLAHEQRMREVQSIANSQTKLVTRLKESHPNLFGCYVDLTYHPDGADELTLADSVQHFERMIKLIEDAPWLGKSVGFFWSRVYSTETGYRTRLCLLFDGLMVPTYLVDYRQIYECWEESTNGAGIGSIFPMVPWCGHALLAEIYFSARKTRYLRPIPSKEHPHFGVSDLPRRKSPKHATNNLTSIVQ